MEDVRLTAFRPEASRFQRLARLYAAVEAAAASANDIKQWEGALVELSDAKGDLTASWRSPIDQRTFSRHLDVAWAKEGENEPVLHAVFKPSSVAPVSPKAKKSPSALAVLILILVGIVIGAGSMFYLLEIR